MSRTVLVTGATGFAGSHVMDLLLARGYRVRVLVRTTSNLRWIPAGRVEPVIADVRDSEAMEKLVAGATWVFHFGGVTRVADPRDFFRVNASGTQSLARAFHRAHPEDGLFLFCSSLAASGPAPSVDRPRREEDPPRPLGPYGQSKLEAERWLEEHLAGELRVVMVRPPAVYGPRDEAVWQLFRWMRRGWLPLPTPSHSRISLIHGEDLAAASLMLAEGGGEGVYHVSDGGIHSWEEFGAAAERAMGKRLRKIRIAPPFVRGAGIVSEWAGRATGRIPVVNRDKVRDMLQPFWICDNARLRAAGFDPRYRLEEGVAQTVSWYESMGWL